MSSPGDGASSGSPPLDVTTPHKDCGPAPPNATVPKRLARYQILGQIAAGGNGTVYRAHDPELCREVAIKLPHRGAFDSDAARERFLQEARSVSALHHPGIVTVYDVARSDDGLPFVVMELVNGCTLEERLRKEPLPQRQVVEMILQVTEAVHAAHQHGLVHRDLKPANILIDETGRLRVADFGLAIHESRQRDHAGEVSGTPIYMAPEQVAGEAHRLDGRADIWSLGVMLYVMLSGRHPFVGRNQQEVFDEILHREPRPLRQIDDRIPAELERVVLKCLSKPVSQRYNSAADLTADLTKVLQHLTGMPTSRGGVPTVATPHGWSGSSRFLAAVVLTAVVIGVVLWYGPPASQPHSQAATSSAGSSEPSARLSNGAVSATVDVVVWDTKNPARKGLSLRAPGALPLRTGDQVRIEAQVAAAHYLYLIWIDSRGQAWPVYPWTPGNWDAIPSKQRRLTRLSLPEAADEGWPMQGEAGMETLLLLARESPLPASFILNAELTHLSAQPMQNPRSLVWFAEGEPVTAQLDQLRGPNFFDPQRIDDPLLQTQRLIRESLKPHFPIIRAISFANAGSEAQ